MLELDIPFDKITVLHVAIPIRIGENGAELMYTTLFIVEKDRFIPMIGTSIPGKVLISIAYDTGIEVILENTRAGEVLPLKANHIEESNIGEILDTFEEASKKIRELTFINDMKYLYGVTEIEQVREEYRIRRIHEPSLPSYPEMGYISTIYVAPDQLLAMIRGEMVSSFHVTTFFMNRKPDYTLNAGCRGLLVINHSSRTALTVLDIGFMHGRVSDDDVEQIHTKMLPQNVAVVARVKVGSAQTKRVTGLHGLSIDKMVAGLAKKLNDTSMYM